ncbi:MAG: hypothetical protein IPK28_04780 [Devosia sp.]|nr:hypothetical protein [Devosia sp.]
MSLKVVSATSDEEIERKRIEREREQASSLFGAAARTLAANLLRAVRGSGASYRLVGEIRDLVIALDAFGKTHGDYPAQDQWQDALNPKLAWGEIRPRTLSRYDDYLALDEGERLHLAVDEAIDDVCSAVLQRQASMLARQIPNSPEANVTSPTHQTTFTRPEA